MSKFFKKVGKLMPFGHDGYLTKYGKKSYNKTVKRGWKSVRKKVFGADVAGLGYDTGVTSDRSLAALTTHRR